MRSMSVKHMLSREQVDGEALGTDQRSKEETLCMWAESRIALH